MEVRRRAVVLEVGRVVAYRSGGIIRRAAILNDGSEGCPNAVGAVRRDDYLEQAVVHLAGYVAVWADEKDMYPEDEGAFTDDSEGLSFYLLTLEYVEADRARGLAQAQGIDNVQTDFEKAREALSILCDLHLTREGVLSDVDGDEQAAAWNWLKCRTRRILRENAPLAQLLVAEVLEKDHVSAERIQELAESVSR